MTTTGAAFEDFFINPFDFKSGDFSFIVETDGYTTFSDDWLEPIVNGIDFSDYRLGSATHGYEPETGPQPVFVAKGPAFKPGAYLAEGSILDEAPTYAYLLGDELPQADGRILKELLAEDR